MTIHFSGKLQSKAAIFNACVLIKGEIMRIKDKQYSSFLSAVGDLDW